MAVGVLASAAIILSSLHSAEGVTTTPPRGDSIIAPKVAGTVVEDPPDPRFPDPVDLVIETPEQMAQHEKEFAAHPERFDGMTIGVAFVNDEVIAAGGPAAERADLAAAGAVPTEPANCARDVGAPSPGQPGRWYLCAGSGDASAYFVPRGTKPEPDLASQLFADVAALSAPVPEELSEQGYYSAAADAVKLRSIAEDAASRALRLSYDPSIEELVSPEGGAIRDYLEQVLRSVDQHYPGWVVVFEIDGRCGAFDRAIRTSDAVGAPGCQRYAGNDLQPREAE